MGENEKDKSIIPVGQYCYDENGICPYWDINGSKPEQENGYCGYLEKGDWELDYFSLLWDQCKECGIKELGYKVFLDDFRTQPEEWIKFDNVKDCIEFLDSHEVCELSLDHDLGECDTKNGYDVLLWIEEKVFNDKSYNIPKITIHSANPPARKKMEQAVKKIEEMFCEKESRS